MGKLIRWVRLAAYHEAGHVLVAHEKKFTKIRAIIKLQRHNDGKNTLFNGAFTSCFPAIYGRGRIYRKSLLINERIDTVEYALAGKIAEELLCPKSFRAVDCGSDMKQAARFYNEAFVLSDVFKLEPFENVEKRVKDLLLLPESKKKLRTLARALVRSCRKTGVLFENEIDKILHAQ